MGFIGGACRWFLEAAEWWPMIGSHSNKFHLKKCSIWSTVIRTSGIQTSVSFEQFSFRLYSIQALDSGGFRHRALELTVSLFETTTLLPFVKN
jgi:hypothetical protein